MTPRPAVPQQQTGRQATGQEPAPLPWREWLTSLLISFAGTLVGTTLVLMPWGTGWDQNYFSGGSPGWYKVWMSPYFRGAVSGIGALNLWIALSDLVETARRARR